MKNFAISIFDKMGGQSFAKTVGLVIPFSVRANEEKEEITLIFQWVTKSKNDLNFVEITFSFIENKLIFKDPSNKQPETYNMTFGNDTQRNDPINGVYFNQLRNVFTDVTGIKLEPAAPNLYTIIE